jgi:hypothetical protein
MSRHKGARKTWQMREEFPHAVEIPVPSALSTTHRPRPLDWWSSRYSNMLLWCGVRVGNSGYCTTGRRERETVTDFVQFRFRDPGVAAEFRAVYGE